MKEMKTKRKVLFIVHHRKDRSPGQRFRFEQYLTFLEAHGYEIDFSILLDKDDDSVFYQKGHFLSKAKVFAKASIRRLKNVWNRNDYDIIFIFREAFMLGTSFFEKALSRSRAKLIFDFDDSIWVQNISDANKHLAFLKNADKTSTIISLCDLVFAGNNYLKQYALQFNKNVVIVPTTIDTTEYVPIKQKNENIVIGWSGSVTTIQHFEYALPILEAIKTKYSNKVSFKVIGDGNYRNEKLGIVGLPWKKEDEVKEISSFDIGFMPLPNDEWANGKCGLKGLQYMALEVPTIMSPVGVNSDIIQDGENGFLADSIDEWVNKISRLIEDSDLRIRMGKAGRKTVVEKYAVSAWEHEYLRLFNNLLDKKN